MSRKRVNDIAREQGIAVKDLLLKLQAAGIDAAAPSATVDEARTEIVIASRYQESSLYHIHNNGFAVRPFRSAIAKPNVQLSLFQ